MPTLEQPPDLLQDAEQLADIIMVLQRCFLLNLSKELSRGNVSFPQFFLLGYLGTRDTATMTEIAQKMGHTTAAATGLVDRLEKMGYLTRAHARDDRRKVIVHLNPLGRSLVERVRKDIVGNILNLMSVLTPVEQKSWLNIYLKIQNYCQGT